MRDLQMKTLQLLGTPLQATSHEEWIAYCQQLAQGQEVVAVDFTNTQIVTMRRCDPEFARVTGSMDYFVPDSMPLRWCLWAMGQKSAGRLYGPDFLKRCVEASPRPIKHYFLGGSDECVSRLRVALEHVQPELEAVGWRNGYFDERESSAIVAEINSASPDFIWVGLGTPRQQEWIAKWKRDIRRGVVFAVGFAFDANAGTKPDSPRWMQRLGLGWLFRLLSEPTRLGPRYLKYNSLFLWYLLTGYIRRDLATPINSAR